MQTSTITQKGQVTIPKNIRDLLGLKKYSQVQIIPKKGFIKLIPAPDITDLIGTIKPKKNVRKNIYQAREVMEKKYQRI